MEELQRSVQSCTEFFQLIHKLFEGSSLAGERVVQECMAGAPSEGYYGLLCTVCVGLLTDGKQLVESTREAAWELSGCCQEVLEGYGRIVQGLQTAVRRYG
jgi:hypothetical protein